MSRLRLIFNIEDAGTKASYFEKIHVSMNKENVDFVQRLAWYIAKAHHKRSMQLNDQKQYKGAYKECNMALQFFNIHMETFSNNRQRY